MVEWNVLENQQRQENAILLDVLVYLMLRLYCLNVEFIRVVNWECKVIS